MANNFQHFELSTPDLLSFILTSGAPGLQLPACFQGQCYYMSSITPPLLYSTIVLWLQNEDL